MKILNKLGITGGIKAGSPEHMDLIRRGAEAAIRDREAKKAPKPPTKAEEDAKWLADHRPVYRWK